MQYVIDRIASCKRNWRVIASTERPEVAWVDEHGIDATTSQRHFFSDRTAAYGYIVREFTADSDWSGLTPGQQIMMPMVDGSQALVNVTQNDANGLTVMDPQTGKQNFVPHMQNPGGGAGLGDSDDSSGASSPLSVGEHTPGTETVALCREDLFHK